MNKKTKKVLSLVLMMVMIISSIPMTSFALPTLCDAIGHKSDWVEKTASTCTVAGVEEYKCERCGEVSGTRETALAKHTELIINATEATCEEDGNKEGKICSVCKYVIKECETINKLGHASEAFDAVEATCTTNGKTAGTKCSRCGDTLTGGTVIPATDHDWKLISFTVGSCTTTPSTQSVEKYRCNDCNETKEIREDVSHNYGSWETVTRATCKAAGEKKRTCRDCGDVQRNAIERLAHTPVSVAAVAPTCTTDGATAGKKCSVADCQEILEGCLPVNKLGHTVVEIEGTPATCGNKGTTDASYCSVCKDVLKEQKELEALEHIMVDDVTNSRAATCTETGIKAQKCSRTGCTYTTTETIPASHKFSSSTKVDATCTTNGTISGYCSVCKKTTTETILATGHKVKNSAAWTITTPPTCTTEGVKKANCTVCKQDFTEKVAATGHNEVVNKPAKDPTCKEVGYTASTHCSNCKVTMTAAQEIAKTECDYGEWTSVTSATCSAPGIEKATCKVCGKETTRTVARLDHTEEDIPAVEATCTTNGSTAGIKCKVCSAVIKEVSEIVATGHDYVADATVTKEATCTEPGKFKGTCSKCGDVKDEDIPAKNHTEEVIPGSEADCTLEGVSEGKKCTTCGEILVAQTVIPALGHDLKIDAEKSVAATCTEKGKNYLKCSRCDYKEEPEVAPLGHTWSEWEEITKPTCDAQGSKKRTCATCNLVEDGIIESLGGHEIVTLTGSEATCTEPGKTNGTHCQKCNTIFEAQEEIPALGHDTEGAEYELIKATTDREGSYAVYCKVCNEAVDPTTIAKIDAASIKLSTEKCTYNGKKRTPSVTVSDVDGNPLTEDVDFEVEYPSGRKDVGEYKITVKFIGNYEGEKELTFTIAAGKTSKITATSSKKDYVKLTWSEVTGATGYRVYVYKTTDSKTRKRVASVEGTSYNLSKDYNGKALKIGSEYKIAIVAYTKLEDGTVIHALAGVAQTFTRTPGKTDISVSSTSGKAKVNWTDVKGESGYEVYYSTSKDGSYKKAGEVKNDVVTFSKSFTKNKTIYFKVRAFTEVEGEKVYGSFSSIKSVKIK